MMHDVLTTVFTEHHVVNRARELDSKRTGHAGNLPRQGIHGTPGQFKKHEQIDLTRLAEKCVDENYFFFLRLAVEPGLFSSI